MNDQIKDLLMGVFIGALVGATILMMFTMFGCVTVESYCKKQCEDRGETTILNTPTMVCRCLK